MSNFINSLKPATIILVATRGNADTDLTDDGYNALVITSVFFPQNSFIIIQHLIFCIVSLLWSWLSGDSN